MLSRLHQCSIVDMTKFKPRPTIYKGIEMRSRLEAGFAAWLDSLGVGDWSYEPHAFASPAGQYLPDFRIERVPMLGGPTSTVFIEVKPMATGIAGVVDHPLASRMAIIWESDPDAVLLIASPTSPLLRVHRVGGGGVVCLESYKWAQATPCHTGEWANVGLVRVLGSDPEPWPDGYWEGPN